MTRREQILTLNQQIGLLDKRIKLLQEEMDTLTDKRSDLVIDGFRNGEQLLDLMVEVRTVAIQRR